MTRTKNDSHDNQDARALTAALKQTRFPELKKSATVIVKAHEKKHSDVSLNAQAHAFDVSLSTWLRLRELVGL